MQGFRLRVSSSAIANEWGRRRFLPLLTVTDIHTELPPSDSVRYTAIDGDWYQFDCF